ncbi:MAG: isoaspartyl peptidase/L-asparaginase [Isosphaeraceae bacterium]
MIPAFCLAVAPALGDQPAVPPPPDKAALVIHGGAGAPSRRGLTAEREAEYRAHLERALRAGHAKLAEGGSSLDAVVSAVIVLEDSPRFNAGKGAVFTHEGKNELDASVMVGDDRRAGAVAGVTTIRNPILAARAVMEKSPHVLLIGKGAEEFAGSVGLEIVDPKYFYTEERWQSLQRELEAEKKAAAGGGPQSRGPLESPGGKPYFGTVGAVAVDRAKHLAAATSTGGMTNKRWGRVGDSPIIGAGTFADDASCAVSGTGHGEFFIRNAVAHDIAALVAYKGLSVKEAADEVVHRKLKAPDRGEGGVIAIDREGRYAMPFNSEGMFRGCITEDGRVYIAIYPE